MLIMMVLDSGLLFGATLYTNSFGDYKSNCITKSVFICCYRIHEKNVISCNSIKRP